MSEYPMGGSPADTVNEPKQKHYFHDEDGGISFRTERKIGDVRIPNYVFDLWMPAIGLEAIGLYAVFCRLEREDRVRGLTTHRLAKLVRMSPNTVKTLRDKLEKWGFIRVELPTKGARLLHKSIVIVVLDAPARLAPEAIPEGWEAVAPWLVSVPPAELHGSAGLSDRVTPPIAPSVIAPSVEPATAAATTRAHESEREATALYLSDEVRDLVYSWHCADLCGRSLDEWRDNVGAHFRHGHPITAEQLAVAVARAKADYAAKGGKGPRTMSWLYQALSSVIADETPIPTSKDDPPRQKPTGRGRGRAETTDETRERIKREFAEMDAKR